MKKTVTILLASALLLSAAGCASGQTTSSTTPSSESQTSSAAVSETASTSATSSTATTDSTATTTSTLDVLNLPLTLEEAVAKFNENVPDATVSSIEIDTSFGQTYLDVKGFDSTTEYKVRIDPTTGTASIKDKESLDNDEKTDVYRTAHTLDVSTVLAPSAAAEKALVEKPGTVKDWELEMDNGAALYKFEIVDSNNRDWDVEVNATNGTVVKIDD